MRKRWLVLSFTAWLPALCLPAGAVDWSYADKFMQREADYWKNVHVGEIRQPGKVEEPKGPWRQPGNIPIPKGEAAISQKKQECSHRFTVGSDCLFEFGKATLTKDAEETLKALGPHLKRLGSHPVTIEGHTDSIDTDEVNQALSEKRAERVKNWLLQNHILEPHAVKTVGFGEKQPVAPNEVNGKDNPAGRALNRRVVIAVDTCTALSAPEGTGAKAAEGPDSSVAGSGDSTGGLTGGQRRPDSATVDLNELLPYSELFTPEEVHDKFARFKGTPLKDPALACHVLVPLDWEEKEFTIPRELLLRDSTEQIAIVELAPKGVPGVSLQIRYIRVGEDVNMRNILTSFAEAHGYELIGRRPGEFNGRQVEEALIKSTGGEDDRPMIRLTASRHGDRVFIVACTCPAKDYDRWKQIFAAAAVSFGPGL